jgi:hypothetical protein
VDKGPAWPPGRSCSAAKTFRTFAIAITGIIVSPVRWLGLLEQLWGVFQVDFRLVYAAAASSVSALKQA